MMSDSDQMTDEQKIESMVEDLWQMIHSGDLKIEKVFQIRGEKIKKAPPCYVGLDGREAGEDLLMGLHPAVFEAFEESKRRKNQ